MVTFTVQYILYINNRLITLKLVYYIYYFIHIYMKEINPTYIYIYHIIYIYSLNYI